MGFWWWQLEYKRNERKKKFKTDAAVAKLDIYIFFYNELYDTTFECLMRFNDSAFIIFARVASILT